MAQKKKLPKDTNKKAKSIVDMATKEVEDVKKETATEIKSIAAQLGRLGGLKGGPARKKALSAKRRKEIAQKAAAARWGHKD